MKLVKYESGLHSTYTDITDRCRLYTLDVTELAEEGAVGTSQMTIDDPDGDLDIIGWRRIKVFDTAATGSNTLISNLTIADRTVKRGPFLTGAGRVWDVTLVDQNTVLGLRVLTGSEANRPAETDVARLQWLLTTLGTPGIPTTDFLNTSGPVAMDAVDYRGQTRLDVIDDCAQASGKNYFVYTKDGPSLDTGLTLGIWYDFADSTAYASSIRLTNVLSDITGDASGFTYEIAQGDGTQLVRSPSRVASGAYVPFDGGAVIEESLAISNQFTRRDLVYPSENVKSLAKATARAQRYLTISDTEDDRITTAVRLPAARVNWIRQGMRCQFRASHLPGYGEFTALRVLRRTVREDSEEGYLVGLELGTGPSSISSQCSVLGYDYVSGLYTVTVGATPAGFYPVNSTYGTFGDYVAGGPLGLVAYNGLPPRPIPNGPANGTMGGWPFSIHGASAPSMPGGIGDGSASQTSFQIIVVGSGALTIWAANTGSGAATATLYLSDMPIPSDGSFDQRTSIDSKALTFPTTEFTVPDDGECLHIVTVGWTAGSYLYGGFTWTP